MGILMGSSTTVTGQIVGSGIVNTEIETRAAHEHRQSRTKPANWKVIEVETRPKLGQRQVLPKPENWNMMTMGQQRYWYKHKSD